MHFDLVAENIIKENVVLMCPAIYNKMVPRNVPKLGLKQFRSWGKTVPKLGSFW